MSSQRTPLQVTCTAYFDMTAKAPKDRLADWLASLPDEATVVFSVFPLGRDQIVATWTEER